MCILFIAIGQHPSCPLIIAANRDEYHARPSAPMHHWRSPPGILAGRDSQAGGAWFGVNARGRIAAVTNHRAAAHAAQLANKPSGQSRGRLLTRFLQNIDSLKDYGEFLHRDCHRFNPFNLIYGEMMDERPVRLHCFSSAAPAIRPLESGFHSISNGALDDPWPKMSRGSGLLKARIASGDIDSDALARMMKDETKATRAQLLNIGIHSAREQHLSSIFITGEDYGTRTTTLLLAAASQFKLHEYNYAPDGSELNRRHFSWTTLSHERSTPAA